MVNDVDPKAVEDAMKNTKVLFVDCWAEWCGPCKTLNPILEELDAKYADNPDVGFLKINTEEHPGYAVQHMIHAIPCVLVYFNGQPAEFDDPHPRGDKIIRTDRIIGARPIDHFENVIEQLLK